MVTKEGDAIVGLEELSRLRRQSYGRLDLTPLVHLGSSISRPMRRAAAGHTLESGTLTTRLQAGRGYVKAKLLEAEQEYQRARTDDYVSRLIRDAAMFEAHRAGLSSGEISDLFGWNRTTQRGAGPSSIRIPVRGAAIAGGSGTRVGPESKGVCDGGAGGTISSVEPVTGVRAFRSEDVRRLAQASSA